MSTVEILTPAPEPESSSGSRWFAGSMAAVTVLAAANLILHISVDPRYGYFRDELYYFACGRHPAWGYVDQPPVAPWIAWLLEHTIGTSLYALRLIPALSAAAIVWMTGWFAVEFGGRRTAPWLAALAIFAAPVYLAMGHFFTMNAWTPLLWMGCALVIIRILKTGNQKLWLWFGVILGIGILSKYDILFFAIGLFAGVLLTPLRRSLARPWIWIGIVIAGLMALPNFLWQLHRGFPFLTLMENIRRSGRDVRLSPLPFLGQQAAMMNFIAYLLVFAALVFFFTRIGKPYRVLGWGFLVTFLTMMFLKGKNYYLAPVYPMMFAAGAVAFERWTERRSLRWSRPTYAAIIALLGAVSVPAAIPLLSEQHFIEYAKTMHIQLPRFENEPQGSLPQLFADMHGWRNMTRAVATYYNSLPPDLRAKTGIFGNNYGEAGAIDFFGPKYGLPPAISTHQNYYYWGPRGYTGESLIVLGEGDPAKLRQECTSVTVVTTLDDPWARPDENIPIYHCIGLKWPLNDVWPKLKHFN